MPGTCFKNVVITPPTGPMDTRSTPDQVQVNGYRHVLNAAVTQKHRLCRDTGFQRFLETDNNADLHDQLFGNTPQPINMIYNAKSSAGISKLFVGTQNTIYALNSSTGNYRIISDQLGGDPVSGFPSTRWLGALNRDIVVLTNNQDKPVYHVIDAASDDDLQAVKLIPDLETLNVSRVALVFEWNNLTFYANVVQDGVRFGNRILWSDFGKALSVIPKANVSLAGHFDLDATEIILNAKPIQDAMLIYTNQGIWEARVVGGTGVLSFGRRWRAKDSFKRTLAYRHTLVSTGDEHYYFGSDGVYKYDFYTPRPELVEWIHKGSSLIFDDIDSGRCEIHSGGYEGSKNRIVWSWAARGEALPTRCFSINVEFPFSCYHDYGVTAFQNVSFDENTSLRSFILERCICTTVAELNAAGGDFVNEGGICAGEQDPVCTEPTPKSFYSNTPLEIDGITMENFLGEADADSLYMLLGDLRIADLCDAEESADACDAEEIFVFALSADLCLKQSAAVYYRELCTSKTGCGTYQRRGYRSRGLSGALGFSIPSDDKTANRFAVEAHPEDQTVPSKLVLRVGAASHAVDPLTEAGKCAILWDTEEAKSLECLSPKSAAEMIAEGLRPDSELEWPIYIEGRYLYFEWTVINDEVDPPDTGGAVCFSRYTIDVMAKPRC